MSTQTEESIFSAEGVNQTPEDQQVKPDTSDSAFADQLAKIVNERGEPKYKDLQTALDALKASQEYIPQLKSRTQELEEKIKLMETEASKHASLEEFVDRMKQSGVQEPSADVPQGGLSQEQVQEMLEKFIPNYLQSREQETLATRNLQAVESTLKEAYGDKVLDVISAKAQELDMSKEAFIEWSKTSPKAVLSLFDTKPQSQRKPSTSTTNIPPIAPDKPSGLQRPQKSLLLGATSKEQREFMAAVRQEVYDKFNVTR